jgi:hypothetical protein
MCPSFEAWTAYLSDPDVQHEWDIFCNPGRFPLGTRIVKPSKNGYVPIGFFQMWHASSGVRWYPNSSQHAGDNDMDFALQWPRSRRQLLPEILAIHLDSCRDNFGLNWNGRQTPFFGPLGSNVLNPKGPALTDENIPDKTELGFDVTEKVTYSQIEEPLLA